MAERPAPRVPDEASSNNDGTPLNTDGGGSAKRAKDKHVHKGRRTMDDSFMMYLYKIKLCTRTTTHNWKLCPWAHPGETAALRRHPNCHEAELCPAVRMNQECPHGETCTYSRNAFECWLHPDRYRTTLCSNGEACNRNICFFAHNASELRTPAPAGSSPAQQQPQQAQQLQQQEQQAQSQVLLASDPAGTYAPGSSQNSPLRTTSSVSMTTAGSMRPGGALEPSSSMSAATGSDCPSPSSLLAQQQVFGGAAAAGELSAFAANVSGIVASALEAAGAGSSLAGAGPSPIGAGPSQVAAAGPSSPLSGGVLSMAASTSYDQQLRLQQQQHQEMRMVQLMGLEKKHQLQLQQLSEEHEQQLRMLQEQHKQAVQRLQEAQSRETAALIQQETAALMQQESDSALWMMESQNMEQLLFHRSSGTSPQMQQAQPLSNETLPHLVQSMSLMHQISGPQLQQRQQQFGSRQVQQQQFSSQQLQQQQQFTAQQLLQQQQQFCTQQLQQHQQQQQFSSQQLQQQLQQQFYTRQLQQQQQFATQQLPLLHQLSIADAEQQLQYVAPADVLVVCAPELAAVGAQQQQQQLPLPALPELPGTPGTRGELWM